MKKLLFFFITTTTSILHAQNTETFHRYLWANYNHFSGNLTSALNWYKSLYSSQCSLYTYKGYLNFLFDTKQYKRIIELIPSLDEKFKNDSEVQLLFATTLEKNNNHKQADDRLIKISPLFKTHSEITLRTTQAYIRRKELENALITIESFLNNSPRKPNNFVFYFLKSQINIQLNQLEKALADITICLDMHPRFDKGWLISASLHEQQGELKKAISGYSTFLELSQGNKAIEQHLASLLLRYKNSTPVQTIAFNKTYFDQAVLLCEKKQYPQALTHLETFLKQEPTHEQARLLKIKLLAFLGKYNDLINITSTWLTEHKDSSSLLPQTIYLLSYADVSLEEIITTLQKLSLKHPDNVWLPLYAADLCIRNKKNNQAHTLLQQSLDKSSDKTLNAKINYQLALLAYEELNYQQMLVFLENAYKIDNSMGHVNNTLAYYWATKGNDIPKAQTFMNKISSTDKTTPHFLDTQAIIFYKQKKYDAAKEMLEKINNNNNATILLHLAKVHYKLNNKKEAELYTNKASSCMTSNHHHKTLKKIQLLLAAND